MPFVCCCNIDAATSGQKSTSALTLPDLDTPFWAHSSIISNRKVSWVAGLNGEQSAKGFQGSRKLRTWWNSRGARPYGKDCHCFASKKRQKTDDGYFLSSA